MIRLRSLALAAAAAALLQATPAAAQPPADTAPAAASGLPAGAGVPRTLRSYTHVFVAFGVAWVLLFGYTVSVARRMKRLEAQLDTLGPRGG